MKILLVSILLLADWAIHEMLRSQMKKSAGKGGFLYAKFTPGAIVSEIRGKIAATVFSRNRGGAVIRNRIKPINRRSLGQSTRRQTLGSLASSWRGLTEAQRDSFNTAAPNFPIQDVLGQTIFLSGEQLYIRLNANLILIGEAQITTAPAPFAFAVFTATVTAEDPTVAASFSVGFTPTPLTAGNTLAVYATPPLSPGVSAPPASRFRFVGVIAAAATSPADLLSEYQALFGDPVAGQKIFIELRPIAEASGQPGTPLRASTVVTVSS